MFVYAAVVGSTVHTLDVAAVSVAEPLGGGRPRLLATSLQTYVTVDEELEPRAHGLAVEPCSRWPGEERLYRLHLDWLSQRRRLLPQARAEAGRAGEPLPASGVVSGLHVVSPEDTFIHPSVIDAAKLFYLIDQVAAVAAIRSIEGPAVTAGFDEAFFVHPARLGDIVVVEAGLTGAGRTSLEALVRVTVERPSLGERRVMARMYATLVSVDAEGRPAPPRRRPETPPGEAGGYRERRRRRLERRRRAEEMAEALLGLLRSRGLA